MVADASGVAPFWLQSISRVDMDVLYLPQHLDSAQWPSIPASIARSTHAMSTTTVKSRHYAALSSRLRQLRSNLNETEVQMDALSEHLKAMQQLGTNHAAQ